MGVFLPRIVDLYYKVVQGRVSKNNLNLGGFMTKMTMYEDSDGTFKEAAGQGDAQKVSGSEIAQRTGPGNIPRPTIDPSKAQEMYESLSGTIKGIEKAKERLDDEKKKLDLEEALDKREKLIKKVLDASKPEQHGHPRFYELLKELSELHSKKNYDYSHGGDPLGNFYRRADDYSMYPGLDLSDPAVVALVDLKKQLDAVLWSYSQKHELKVEGRISRLKDIAVYSVLAMILEEETVDEEIENKQTGF